MHKYLISLALLIVAATIGSTRVAAQSSINLDASAPTITFTTGFGVTTMSVGAGTMGGVSGALGPQLTSATTWSTSSGTLMFTPTHLDPTLKFSTYTVTNTVPLTFTLNDGGTILTGNLTFSNATVDISGFGKKDTARLTLYAQLTITGGSICTSSLTCPDTTNTVQLTILMDPHDGATDFASGYVLNGNLVIANGANVVTPEPTSMLLFGTGLLAFGGILRRKLLA